MKIQPISVNDQLSFGGYRNISKSILNSDRKELINIAEFFHSAQEKELQELTGLNQSALKKLKEAINGVVMRKKCYISDGSSFCKQKAEELEQKAAQRHSFYAAV